MLRINEGLAGFSIQNRHENLPNGGAIRLAINTFRLIKT